MEGCRGEISNQSTKSTKLPVGQEVEDSRDIRSVRHLKRTMGLTKENDCCCFESVLLLEVQANFGPEFSGLLRSLCCASCISGAGGWRNERKRSLPPEPDSTVDPAVDNDSFVDVFFDYQ